jgi:uncharacterized protein (TIGR02118 family)
MLSRRRVLGCAGALAASAALPRAFADGSGVHLGMQAYTAIFPGGADIHFDHDYYRNRHLVAMQRDYGAALARVEARRPVVAAGERPSPYAAIVNFWIPDAEAFAKAGAAHGQEQVADKAHFTNSEQQVQREAVFGEAGKPAGAVAAGERGLTVLDPAGPADRFDYDYYRDRHLPTLLKLFGAEAISRIEARKAVVAPDGRNAPRYACTANIYVADAQAFAAAADKNHGLIVDDISRFTTVSPASFMTEVFGAFDS